MRTWGSIAIAGFLMAVIGNGGVVWAEQYVASGLAAVVVAMVPFWVVMIEAVLPGGERLTRRTLGGLAVGFVGIVVLVWPELFGGGREGQQFLFGIISLQIGVPRVGAGDGLHEANVDQRQSAGRGGAADAAQRCDAALRSARRPASGAASRSRAEPSRR